MVLATSWTAIGLFVETLHKHLPCRRSSLADRDVPQSIPDYRMAISNNINCPCGYDTVGVMHGSVREL